jgi:hypothetical protein
MSNLEPEPAGLDADGVAVAEQQADGGEGAQRDVCSASPGLQTICDPMLRKAW